MTVHPTRPTPPGCPTAQALSSDHASAPLSVWTTGQASPSAQRGGRYLPDSTAHPAKMLPAIARHAIEAFTAPEDLILDPMCGIGTTLVEAARLGRHAVGIELERQWAELARANLMQAHRDGAEGAGTVYRGDARDADRIVNPELHGSVKLLLTSPPYGNSLHGQVRSTRETGKPGIAKFHDTYGSTAGNLAHAPTDELLDAFTQILRACRPLLADDAHVVVTARPWRRHGELVDLPSAIFAAGRAAGLEPVTRCVALLAGVREGELLPRPSFFQLTNVKNARSAGVPMACIAHEDVLVMAPTRPAKSQHAGGKALGTARAECTTCPNA
ncbi:TRM11 family methyltransferase [Streptacidiphilus sp. MAP5-3]|uniref:TRM11 family SAM-dependent methyltransferase n=1 Tax=unclassified Streptacidiphilus TaxID=2643834 RepID=UPI0035146052